MPFTHPEPRGVYLRERGALTAAEVAKHPWAFECTKPNCRFAVCAGSEAAANQIESNHPCPYAGGITSYGWSITVTLVEEVWAKLDADMMSLQQPAPDTDYVALKARLRAFAEVLAIFMKPHFTTADEIAREAKRRYDNRLDPEYCTPGLNQRRFEPPPGSKRLSEEIGTTKATVPYTPPKAIFSKLKPEEIAAIKKFSELGFKVEQLAKTYGVAKAVIEAVIAS